MRYPEAVWRGDGVAGGTYTGTPYRIVLHTTETQGVPGYNEGRSAPHLTYSPRTRTWYQHTDLRYAARALRNEAGGVQTNRANAIQVEIICYSAKGIADRVGVNGVWVGDLPDHAYTDLRRFVDWCGDRFGVKPEWPGKQAFNSLEANTPGFRMSHSEWNRFNGVCGHQHVPENCVTADTPILCADLTWRPAGDLLPGDELIAFDEESPDQSGRRLRRATVTHNEIRRDALLLVNTSEGSVRCNYEHPWLVRRGDRQKWGSWQWVRARDLQPDDEAMFILRPWTADRSHEAGWAAGMLDADGWCSVTPGGVYFGMAQRASQGRLVDEFAQFFKQHDIDGRQLVVGARNLGREPMHRYNIQSRGDVMRALGIARPKRLLSDSAKVWEDATIGKLGHRATITSIEAAGTGSIASLTTSTRTYIAAGFAMHNTHWDPGAFDWTRLIPTTPPPPEEPDMPKLPLFSWARPSYEWAIQNRIYTLTADPDAVRETEEAQRQMVFLHRFHQNMRGGLPMQLTAEQIAAIQDGAVMKVGKKLVGP